MATYLILNIAVMAMAVLGLRMKGALAWNKTMSFVLVLLLGTTAVFDTLMIDAGIVAYNHDLLLGMTVGEAPIEDFFYALLAALVIPNVWNLLATKDGKHA